MTYQFHEKAYRSQTVFFNLLFVLAIYYFLNGITFF